METLATLVVSFGTFIVGSFVRLALFPLLLITLVAIPALVVFAGVWGYEALRQRLLSVISVDGLLWKRDLYYTPGHTWLSWDGAAVRVGLDDLAQRLLVDMQMVELPQPGAEVHQGQTATVVTCGNKRAELASPVDGIVTAVNEAVSTDPTVIHRDPYARGWLFAVAPMDSLYMRFPRGKTARNWLRSEAARLTQFLEGNLGVAAADGGELVLPAPSLLSNEQWDAITLAFLGPGKAAVDTPGGSDTLTGAGSRGLPRPLVPFAAVLAAVGGGLYVILLPVIGLGLLLGFSGLWAWRGIRLGVDRMSGAPLRPRGPAE